MLSACLVSLPASAAAPTVSLGWGPDGTATNGNITITTTKGTAGIYTGSHTLHVSSTSTYGYNITLSNTTNSNSLTNSTNTNNNAASIASITGSTDSKGVALTDNTWGYTLTNPVNDTNKATAIWHAIPIGPKDSDNATTATIANLTKGDDGATGNKDYTVTYGAKLVADAKEGSYKTADNALQYTITANLPATPTIATVAPATPKKSNTAGATTDLTITGTNLDTAYDVYLQLPSDTTGKNKITCSNPTPNADGTSLTCKLPTNGSNITENQAYTLYVQTQAANPGSKADAVTYQPASEYTESTDGNVTAQLDKNMIPIKWDKTNSKWVTVTDDELADNANTHKWFQYGTKESNTVDNRRWANAVTVSDPTKYDRNTNQDLDSVTGSSVLGYWVWIPRYEYQVRSNNGNTPSAKNFTIRFQTTAQKSTPTCANEPADETKSSTWKDCAWGTNPAFDWGGKPLAGFWMGKFETTGSSKAPTVLPSAKHIGNGPNGTISGYYDVAKSLGVQDSSNGYGAGTSVNCNTHHLAKLTSHMLKNSEWGAAAYLSASKYGAGVNAVQINSVSTSGTDGDGNSSYGQTGGSNYTSNTNQSTTGNTTGVYDMSGGAWEYVMGSYGNNQGSSNYSWSSVAKPPYVDTYNFTSTGSCSWATCGGHALYETAGWGSDYAGFVGNGGPWFSRGGYASNGSDAGLFYFIDDYGSAVLDYGFRVALRAS